MIAMLIQCPASPADLAAFADPTMGPALSSKSICFHPALCINIGAIAGL